jgi:transketolase
MRDAVGCAVAELGEHDPDIVVVTADVAYPTRAYFFGKRFPRRFVNVGVSEQDAVGFAAGLALAGKKPFVFAFSMFLMRAWEQIRNSVDVMKLPVRFVATHSGFSDHGDGVTHQCLEDVALARTLVNMTVVVPADALQAYQLVQQVHSSVNGPAYVRIGRDYAPPLPPDAPDPKLGKLQLVREGYDVAIIAAGPVTAHAVEAAKRLERAGISAAVANLHTVKPVDADGVEKLARRTGLIVVVEEHLARGGVFSAIAEVLVQYYPVPAVPVAAKGYGRSAASVHDLYELHELNVQGIVRSVLRSLRLKG